MRLSKNFTLSEFTKSETARIESINNNPGDSERQNMVLTAALLQEIRDALGRVDISSGYRCEMLNKAVGGSSRSDHMDGRAADFRVKGMSIEEAFKWIVETIDPSRYRIVIQEGSWIHLSIPDGKRQNGLIQRKVNRVCINDVKYSYKG